jgi:hypothetical protein
VNKGCQLQQSERKRERSETPQGFVKKEVQRHCEIELIDATVNYTGLLRWRNQFNYKANASSAARIPRRAEAQS